MTTLHSPNQNQLLAALPVAEFKRIAPHLERVFMSPGNVFHDPDGKFEHVYFPTSAIVSLQYDAENGAPAEIACVGKEGILGIPLFMGGNASPSRAFVRMAGYGYKLKMRLLMEEFNRAGSMRHMLLRYTQALITQTSQIALCNRDHPLAQRLCRWLLLTLDRSPSNELSCTPESIARLFGVGLQGVMEALKELQQAGFIIYRRGHLIEVLDRSGLKSQVCECYNLVKMEFDRYLGLDWDWRPMPESVKSWSSAGVYAQM